MLHKRSQPQWWHENIIEAYTTIGTGCSAFPFGVYDDEEPVGFLMIGHNMAALDGVCEEEYCVITYEPENKAAKNLYASFGFAETGEIVDDEVVAVLRL